MTQTPLEVVLKINAGEQADDRELEQLSIQLRDELLRLDEVKTVELLKAGPPPPGTRVVETIAVGSLLLKLVSSGAAVTGLFALLRTWITRDKDRAITLHIGKDKLILKGHSSEEENKLFKEFLEKHQEIPQKSKKTK